MMVLLGVDLLSSTEENVKALPNVVIVKACDALVKRNVSKGSHACE